MEVVLETLWMPLLAVSVLSALGWLILFLTRRVGAVDSAPVPSTTGISQDIVREPLMPAAIVPDVPVPSRPAPPRPTPAAPAAMPMSGPPPPLPMSGPPPPLPAPSSMPMTAAPPPAARPAAPLPAEDTTVDAEPAPPPPPRSTPTDFPAWAAPTDTNNKIPASRRPAPATRQSLPRPQVPPPMPLDAPPATRNANPQPPRQSISAAPTNMVPQAPQPPRQSISAPPTNMAPPQDAVTLYTPPSALMGRPPAPPAPAAPAGFPAGLPVTRKQPVPAFVQSGIPPGPQAPPVAPAPTPFGQSDLSEAETVVRLDVPPKPSAPAAPPPYPPARPAPARSSVPLPTPSGSGMSAASGQVARVGSNIVIHSPVQPAQQGILLVPHRLEVIYGNFSPSDPKEIPFYYCERLPDPCRMLLSSAPGDSIWHIQLNHFSIYPELHADIVCNRDGVCVLTNKVKRGQEERFQTRVNGAVLMEGESRVLSPGDILSLGIYRLRFS